MTDALAVIRYGEHTTRNSLGSTTLKMRRLSPFIWLAAALACFGSPASGEVPVPRASVEAEAELSAYLDAASPQAQALDDNPCPIQCRQEYAPVCGSDGVTYSNDCSLLDVQTCQGKRGLSIVSQGACV